MMTSSIGKGGIVLLEVLTAVAILSVGILIVFRPLLSGLSAVSYLDHRREAGFLLDQEYWEIEKQVMETGTFDQGSKNFVLSGRTQLFNFSSSVNPVANFDKLRSVTLSTSWMEGDLKKKLSRETYFLIKTSAE